MKKSLKKGLLLAAMLVMLFGMSRVIYARTYESETVNCMDLSINDVLMNGVTLTYDGTMYIRDGDASLQTYTSGTPFIVPGPRIISNITGVIITTDGPSSIQIMLMPYDLPEESSVPETVPETAPEEEIPAWKPTTPEDIERFSYVSGSEPEVTVGDGTLVIENSVQGPACMESMKAALPEGYEIGHTYNIYPYGLVMEDATERYHSKEDLNFTMKIPADLAKEGRTFMFLCISEDGKPFLFENASENADEITITTNRFYAYALIYTDSAN